MNAPTEIPDPRYLSRNVRRALVWLVMPGPRFFRTARGYGRYPYFIRLSLANELRQRGLARIEQSGELIATGAGRTVEAVMSERAERKRA